jgi:hypothetical protein
MMTFLRLHIFDESPHPIMKPLLGAESLRRLAWSVYYLDATIDGGNYGFTAIPDGAFTISLPCDEKPFLQHVPTTKEYMLPTITPFRSRSRWVSPTSHVCSPNIGWTSFTNTTSFGTGTFHSRIREASRERSAATFGHPPFRHHVQPDQFSHPQESTTSLFTSARYQKHLLTPYIPTKDARDIVHTRSLRYIDLSETTYRGGKYA